MVSKQPFSLLYFHIPGFLLIKHLSVCLLWNLMCISFLQVTFISKVSSRSRSVISHILHPLFLHVQVLGVTTSRCITQIKSQYKHSPWPWKCPYLFVSHEGPDILTIRSKGFYSEHKGLFPSETEVVCAYRCVCVCVSILWYWANTSLDWMCTQKGLYYCNDNIEIKDLCQS